MTCKKVIKSINLSPKKSFLFQYCMSIKLLCNLEACHVVNFKMTVYLLFRFSEIYLLKKKLNNLFSPSFDQTIIKCSKYFDFATILEYSGCRQNQNIWRFFYSLVKTRREHFFEICESLNGLKWLHFNWRYFPKFNYNLLKFFCIFNRIF